MMFRDYSDNILRQILSLYTEGNIYHRIFSKSFYNFFHHRLFLPWWKLPVVENCDFKGFREIPLINNVFYIRRHCVSKDFLRILQQDNFPPPATFTMAKSTSGGKLCRRRIQIKSFDIQYLMHEKELYIEEFSLKPSKTQFSTTGNFHHGKSSWWWKNNCKRI